MRLVVDANILVAAFLKDGKTREILFEEDKEFFAPEYLLSELDSILKSAKFRRRLPLGDKDISELKSLIISHITFLPEKPISSFIKRSIPLVAHVEDAPYIGLSLALNLPLWSNDFVLKEQSLVKVYTTSELLNILT